MENLFHDAGQTCAGRLTIRSALTPCFAPVEIRRCGLELSSFAVRSGVGRDDAVSRGAEVEQGRGETVETRSP